MRNKADKGKGGWGGKQRQAGARFKNVLNQCIHFLMD